MYKRPIDILVGEIEINLEKNEEEMAFEAARDVLIDVDKEELIKALNYDRNQYKKGYNDGWNDGYRDGKIAIKKMIEGAIKNVE